ncbi:hypothetical protein, partial [Streptomyces flavidovirens]
MRVRCACGGLSPTRPFPNWGQAPRPPNALAEGAKADVRRKVREGAEWEMKQLRDRAQREI